MKHLILLGLLVLTFATSHAQDINWRALNNTPAHLVALQLGADYGTYYGITYGYAFQKGALPLAVGADFSLPFGDQLADDWKLNLNVQAELWHSNAWSLTVKPELTLRRYASDIATVFNVGAGATAVFGLVKPRWGIVGEANYNAALASNIRHDRLKEYYPDIRDGWYGNTGGNFQFGLRAQYTIHTWSAFLKLGKTYAQDFKDNPTLPFYFNLAVQKRF